MEDARYLLEEDIFVVEDVLFLSGKDILLLGHGRFLLAEDFFLLEDDRFLLAKGRFLLAGGLFPLAKSLFLSAKARFQLAQGLFSLAKDRFGLPADPFSMKLPLYLSEERPSTLERRGAHRVPLISLIAKGANFSDGRRRFFRPAGFARIAFWHAVNRWPRRKPAISDGNTAVVVSFDRG